jgi:N-methylhydantoinase A
VGKPSPRRTGRGGDAESARKNQRPVYFSEFEGVRDVAVYDRLALAVGVQFAGPAVLEEPDSTTICPPGHSGEVDDHLNLVLRPI